MAENNKKIVNTYELALDDNDTIRLKCELVEQATPEKSGTRYYFRMSLDSDYDQDAPLTQNLRKLIKVKAFGEQGSFDGNDWFSVPAGTTLDNIAKRSAINVTINDQDVASIDYDYLPTTSRVTGQPTGRKFEVFEPEKSQYKKLTVSETRMLARHLTEHQSATLPYAREKLNGYDPKQHQPITDLHTHLSGQLTGEEWEAIIDELQGTDREVFYPKDLLENIAEKRFPEMKVDVSECTTKEIPRIPFKPAMYQGFAVPSEKEEFRDKLRKRDNNVIAEEEHTAYASVERMASYGSRSLVMLCGEKVTNLFREFQKNLKDLIYKEPELDSDGKSKKELVPVEGISLSDVKANNPEFFDQFIKLLTIAPDQITGQKDMDGKLYRYRNPLEKNIDLQGEKMYRVMKTYAEQGVRYAEMSSTEVLTPEWLKATVEAIDVAKERLQQEGFDNPPDIRLLVGIHRSQSADAVARYIEKAKFAAQHPYVVGVDFMGYETNKTEAFNWALYEIARWTKQMVHEHPDAGFDEFVIRVHAGETSKNANNIRAAVEIADKFNKAEERPIVKVRVGHAVHGNVDDDLIGMINDNKVVIEYIPDSNIALDNVDYLTDVPMAKRANDLDYVINSDGAGMYRTTPLQGAKAGLFSGLELNDLDKMHQFEEGYIAGRQHAWQKKQTWFDKHKTFKGDLDAFTEAYREDNDYTKDRHLPKRFDGKAPFLLAGASGENWENIVEQSKNGDVPYDKEIAIAMNMIVTMFDPNQLYFVTGRVKDRGVEHLLDQEVRARDEAGKPNFDMVATIPSSNGGSDDIAKGVSWVNKAKGNVEQIPPEVIGFMEKYGEETDREGYSLFIGGGDFTRKMIGEVKDRDLRFGVVKGPVGTADKVVQHTDPRRVVTEYYDKDNPKPLAKAILGQMISRENMGTNELCDSVRREIAQQNGDQNTVIDRYYEQAKSVIEAREKNARSEKRGNWQDTLNTDGTPNETWFSRARS